MLSISISVGNSPLSLVAALKDLSNEGGVLSTPEKILIAFTPPNLYLTVFGAKKLACLFC